MKNQTPYSWPRGIGGAVGERVALLVAPAPMRESPEYLMAFGLVEQRHSDQRTVADEELWHTAREFGKTYKKRLGSFEVTHLYVLTAPDGTVGRGIFQMWRYLVAHQESKTIALFPTGDKEEAGTFEEVEGFELTVIGSDTARYAVPTASTASVLK